MSLTDIRKVTRIIFRCEFGLCGGRTRLIDDYAKNRGPGGLTFV